MLTRAERDRLERSEIDWSEATAPQGMQVKLVTQLRILGATITTEARSDRRWSMTAYDNHGLKDHTD